MVTLQCMYLILWRLCISFLCVCFM